MGEVVQFKKERAHCCVKKCRRSIPLWHIEEETKHGDGWGVIISFVNGDTYLCPLHRLELADTGRLAC